ncbi:hypothetical protein JAAARDRAFT_197139 [Jaapia argillacea MUCL 33604]|uniref:Uncharacterized protein n=1 Tax=Jaapia argillacea MUCL 33604 TaxID=933084 RepID=A0A067PFJ2_9AGAM|nr:hypothetical protein JAAARDRAFT_197139 [Jaapia argillacea MUCL 33604]
MPKSTRTQPRATRSATRSTAPISLAARGRVNRTRSKSLTSVVDSNRAPTPVAGPRDRISPTVSPLRSFAEVVTMGLTVPALSRPVSPTIGIVVNGGSNAPKDNNNKFELSTVVEGSIGTDPVSPVEDPRDNRGWIPIVQKARKAKSLDSLGKSSKQKLAQDSGNSTDNEDLKFSTTPRNNQFHTQADTKASAEVFEDRCKASTTHSTEHREVLDTSKGEGPSRKGKGPDPRNWGGAELTDEELDIDVQRVAMASWKLAKEIGEGVVPDPNEFTSDDDNGGGAPSMGGNHAQGIWFDPLSIELQRELAESKVRSARLAELLWNHHTQGKVFNHNWKLFGIGNSAVVDTAVPASIPSGVHVSGPCFPPPTISERKSSVVTRVSNQGSDHGGHSTDHDPPKKKPRSGSPIPQDRKRRKSRHKSVMETLFEKRDRQFKSSPPPSSPSEPSSSDSEGDSSVSTSEEYSDPPGRGRPKHRKKHTSVKAWIKPQEPATYDGVADANMFVKFVQDSNDYVLDGGVARQKHV